jgi:hypothetical protein
MEGYRSYTPHSHFHVQADALRESRPQKQTGPTYILNGDRVYSHAAAIARAKTMGSMTVQFVPKSGLAQEAVSCDNMVALAAALPPDFKGGYVTMRGNRVHERAPVVQRQSIRKPSWAYLSPSESYGW